MSPEELVAWHVAILVAGLAAVVACIAGIVALLRGNFVAGALFVAGCWVLILWAERTAKRVPELPTR